jgi:hypothetical protein
MRSRGGGRISAGQSRTSLAFPQLHFFILHSHFFIHGSSIAQAQKDFTFLGNP